MTHKFLPTALVNYSKPFRFVIPSKSMTEIYEHTYDRYDEIVIKDLTRGVDNKGYNFGEKVQNNIDEGRWLVIDENIQMPLGEFFKFETKQGTCVCTYTKQTVGNPLISWNVHSTRRYTEKDCRANIESGEWIVLPSEPAHTAGQSFEDAFTAVQDMVKKPSYDAATILDSIKAFTQSGKFSIGIHKGVYTVYGKDDEYKATSDKQLVEVMRALEILEGCLD